MNVNLKIVSLSASHLTGSPQRVTVFLEAEEGTELSAAVEAVEALFRQVIADRPAQAEVSRDTTTAQEASTPRKRRGTAEATSAATEPAQASAAQAEAPTEGRRRRNTAAEAPTEPVITDADLAKACSDAAAALGNPGLVIQVLKEDFQVKNASEIPPNLRQKFLDTLKWEVEGDAGKAA